MKRIICTILVLSMLLSAMPAFAKDYLETYKYMDQVYRFDVSEFLLDSDDDAAAGGVDPEQEMINFLDFAGVWDDASLKKNAHITQTEFSIIMSKLTLGSENALIDVYLANPDDTKVTYKDAYKQLITALGYWHMCERYDNPEDWIIFVADEIDLLVSVPNNMNEYITRAELAKIITKALNIDISVIEYTSDGYHYEVAEGKTLLNSVHNLHDISGFVNAVYGLSVYSGNDCREGYIQIDRENIKTSGLDLDHYLGRMVRAYASYDELRDEYSIVHIDYDNDAKYLEIDFADIADIRNDEICYYDENGEEKEIGVSNLKNIAENGKQLNSISEMSDFAENEGKIILTSSEKYGDIDTAVIYKYTYAIVEYNDTLVHEIGLKNQQKYNGSTAIPVNEDAVNVVYLDGEKINITELPANVAMRFFRNEATGYTEIIAATTKLIGTVNGVDGDYYIIDDSYYRISRDMLKLVEEHKNSSITDSKKVKVPELNLTTTFYILDDVIIGYAKTNEYLYGYLKSATQERSALDPDLTLKIFSQEGEWIELKVTKPIELDGQKNVEKSEFYDFLVEKSSEVEVTKMVINNIVRYKASGDTLVALDTVIESRFETETDDDLVYNTFNTYDGNWTNSWLAVNYPYLITENTVLFAIPNDRDDESMYSMTNNTSISGIAGSEGTMPSHFFNTNEMREVGVVLIEGTLNEIRGGQSSGGNYYYVTKIMNAVIDADNQEYGYKVVAERVTTTSTVGAVANTVEASFYVSENLFKKNPIAVGDFISATVSGGKATSWKIELAQGRVPTETSYSGRDTTGFFATGRIKALDAATDRIVLDVGEVYNSSGDLNEPIHPVLCRAKLIINPDAQKIYSTTLSAFHVGDMIYTYTGYGIATFIVKNVFD